MSQENESGMVFEDALKIRGSSTDLVFLLHAFTSSPERLQRVQDVARAADGLADADILTPGFNAGLFSADDPIGIVGVLVQWIDVVWNSRKARGNGGSCDQIVLVGHSLGALLARKAYVVACGENLNEAPFEPESAMSG